MPKIAVLGSNAFSGQDFIDLLLDDPAAEIIGISRSPEKDPIFLRYRERRDLSRYRFHRLDLNSDMDALLALLDREKPDRIVNFAAQSEVGPSWDHPDQWFATNTVALARLVNHLRGRSYLQRYLHVSSPEAYGNCTGTVTESTPDNPSTPYAASKAAADMLLQVYHRQYGFPLLTVRATNVYGARQQLFKIIPRTAIFIKSNRRIELHGGGQAVKSYIHVRDVSTGELAILDHGRLGERYHLSPDGGLSVRDVVSRIALRMGRRLSEVAEDVADRPGQDAAYIIDSTKARRELGWRSAIGIDQGLDEVVAWVEGNWLALQQQPHHYLHKP